MKHSISLAAAAIALALAASGTRAAELPAAPFDGTLPPLLTWSETHSPMVRAMEAEAEAKRQQIVMAGALDDPMLGVEWRDIDTGSPTLNPSKVGSMRYTVSQMLPWWGTRDLKARIAQANAEQAALGVNVTRTELRAQIRQVFAERYRTVVLQDINRDIERLLQQMELAARNRYQVGMGGQSDIIRLQTELSMLRNEQIALHGAALQARSRLAGLLNVPSQQLAADPAGLPDDAADHTAEQWLSLALQNNPDLLAARKGIESATGQWDLAQLNSRPGVKVGVSAIQMESRVPMMELMLEVQIPLQQGVRRADRSEAAAMLTRASTQAEAQQRMVEQDIQVMLTMLTTARSQLELLDKTLLPQAELTFQSTLTSYQSGKGEFAALLEAQQQIRKLRQLRLMAHIEHFQAWSGLIKLTGDQP